MVNGQLVNTDAISAQFTGHRVPEPAFWIMVFDRQDRVVGFPGRGFDDVLGQRLDAVGVDDGDSDTFLFQSVRRFQRFEQSDAA